MALDDTTRETLTGLLIPVQFIAIAAVVLGLIALVSRAWPTGRDLGLKRGLDWREFGLIVVVFLVSHGIFWLLSLGAAPDPGKARRHFEETGLAGPLVRAVAAIIVSAILAPLCEELLYHGAALRPIHDALARRGRPWVGAALGIVASSALFAIPHLVWIIVFGRPLWTYLCARALHGLFPR